MKHRVATTLGLALCLIGCAAPVALLTGGDDGCYPGMSPIVTGLLITDPEHGTAIKVERVENNWAVPMPTVGRVAPVMWPKGYTGRRVGSEVEVLSKAGDVVATTGRRYGLEPQVQPPSIGASVHAFVTCGAVTEE